MAQTIKLRRSASQGAIPTVSQLSLGEIAINTHDGILYIKKDDGTESIVTLGAGSSDTAAELLTKIKTVDGTGTGLDADLLDGQQGSYYAAASHVHSYLPLSGGTVTGTTTFTDSIELAYSGGIETFNLFCNNTGFQTLNIASNDLDAGVDKYIYIGKNTGSNSGNTTTIELGDSAPGSLVKAFGNFQASGTVTATGGNSTNWNTAYGWGDHSTEGYLTSYTDTNTTYSAGTGITLTGTTFSLTDTNAKLSLAGGTLTGTLVQEYDGDIWSHGESTNRPVSKKLYSEVNIGTPGTAYTDVRGEADLSAIDGHQTFSYNAAWVAVESHGGRLPTLAELEDEVGAQSGQSYDGEFLWTCTPAGPHHVWVCYGRHSTSGADPYKKIVDITDAAEVYRTRAFFDVDRKTRQVTYDSSGDLAFGDSQKATFGAGDDLQIFHDGSSSYIQDAGTGQIRILGDDVRIMNAAGTEISAQFIQDGQARLKYDNSTKIATTATGIDVTGNINASGLLKVGVNDTEYANNYVRFKSAGAGYIDHGTVGQAINFRVSNSSSLDTNALTINSTGINVTGTVTATSGNSTNWNTAYGWGDHSTQSYATQSYVGTQISNLVDSSPATLDTLNELAAALGDDPNFATTVTNSIATKLPLTGGTLTGALSSGAITSSGTIKSTNATGLILDTGAGYRDVQFVLTGNTGNGTLEIIPMTVPGSGTASYTTHFKSLVATGTTRHDIKVDGNSTFAGTISATDATFNSVTISTGNLNIRTQNESTATNVIYLGVNNGNSSGTSDYIGTGLVFAPQYGGYSKRSAGIMQIGEGNYFRSGLAFYTNDTADPTTDWSERMRISKEGNVGIGTTNPIMKLQVVGNIYCNAGTMYIDSGRRLMWGNSTQWIEGTNDTSVEIGVGSQTRATFLANGNVGIGTSSPSQKLDVSGVIRVASGSASGYIGSGSAILINPTTTDFAVRSDNALTFGSGGPYERMRIDSAGNVGIGCSPNARFSIGISGTQTAPVFILGNDADTGLFRPADNTLAVTTAGTERMRIDSAGVTTFKYNTKVYTAGYPETRLGISDSNYFNFIFDNPNDALSIGKNGSSKMTLTATGNVGIGASTPNTRLQIASSGANAYSSTLTKGGNHSGLTLVQSNNANDMVGVMFGTGTDTNGTHWSGITGSRSDSASHWGTQLNFYTHNNDLSTITDATRKMVITGTGDVTASGSFRAPTFYDSNNTSYYLNPAETSVINSLVATTINRNPVVTLSGDVTGAATMTNLGSINITTTVANNSHEHSSYVLKAGDTMTGTLNIVTADGSESIINLLGGSQGTGKLYVGQSTTHGGGIEYNGDGTPASSGSGADYVTLFRRTNGVDSWTARNFHSSNDWKFRGIIYANDTQRVFADNYHPNADKWTTPRSHTVTLTGEVTGTASQSVDGTGNRTWSIATTMSNGSLDDQYVTVGGRYSGNASALNAANKASIRLWDVSTATDAPSGSADGLITTAGWDSNNWATQQYHDFHSNDLYLRSLQNGTWMTTWDRVFHDTYHPNADKWTTARSHTVTLTGGVTGTASQNVDGTGNRTWTIATTVASISAPSAPSITATSVVGETIEITFSQSSTSNVDLYEVWSDGATGSDYSLIARVPEDDVAASMSIIDSSFDSGGTVAYRVYAIKEGVYSTAATATRAFTVPTNLDVTSLSVIADTNVYHINYNKPDSRFVDHIEIYKDVEAAQASLSRTGASLIYSGDNSSFTYSIAASDLDNYHQFWAEVVTV